MSTPYNDRLYRLLPSIYRQRDSEFGEPLRTLLSVMSGQVDALEADIAALYDNWFVETCDDWVVPYIGDLIGYRTLHDAGEPVRESAQRAAARARILFPRRDVGNTLRYRRRKGTLALLDDLASAVSGWPARAVEFSRLVAATQSLKHLRLTQGGTADVRRTDLMGRIGSVSDQTAHLVDVRRPQSKYGPGRYNEASVGVLVWRLRSYAVERTQAYCVEWEGRECYTFSVLGNDCPLFSSVAGAAEVDPMDPAERLAPLPVALRRADIMTRHGHVKARYYGAGASFALWLDRHATNLVPLKRLVVVDLSDWNAVLRPGEVGVDPETGRIMFAPDEAPDGGLWVSYHYGLSADLGGGTYARVLQEFAGNRALYRVGAGGFAKLEEALQAWRKDKPPHAVIEFAANDVYVEPVRIAFEPKMQSLEIRAANGVRPVIRLLDYQTNRADSLTITGEPASRLILEGLLIGGRGIQLKGPFAQLTIRHCTLVPGWEVGTAPGDNDNAQRDHVASLALARTGVRVLIEHSILGPIVATPDNAGQEPLPLTIVDSVVDSVHPRYDAIGSHEKATAHVVLRIVRSTVFGGVRVNAVELAENCIFNGLLEVARRQTGCVRFCYVPPGSNTPRRFECQPDLVLLRTRVDARADAAARVRPTFNDVHYGWPGYCQLADACAQEIVQGADDEAEMGVFHDLYQPQRLANLRARLAGFVPADVDVGIIVVS